MLTEENKQYLKQRLEKYIYYRPSTFHKLYKVKVFHLNMYFR
jgi:hypothetical protein